MVKISNREYERLHRLDVDSNHGRVLTPDGLRFICSANDYDAEKIGQHFLEVLAKFGSEHIVG